MEQELTNNGSGTDERIGRPQTLEEWAATIKEAYESEESIESSCKKRGIKPNDFYWYRKRCIKQGLIDPNNLPNPKDRNDLSFAKLDLPEMKQETNTDDGLTICKNGWEIRLDENFNEAILMKVMKVMKDA